MACANTSSIFLNDLPSYGLIGLISLGLILYLAYLIAFIRNHSSSTSVYIHFSQLSLFFLLISPMLFLVRPGFSSNLICSSQTLAIQILPFCFLLGFNIHYIWEWLRKLTNGSTRRSSLISFSSFLIFFLAVLIQTVILLIWFYHNQPLDDEICSNQCSRPYFLCSLIFHFLLLFCYSFQSTIQYHHNQSQKKHLMNLFASLLALGVTIIWIGFYLVRSSTQTQTFSIDQNYILAYGMILFTYAFLGPFLYEQLFYRERRNSMSRNLNNRTTFKCLSLTKEQQRAFMAAYIKRNLTASCEDLTTKTNHLSSLSNQLNPTRHSTLSVESLCPTMISTISYGTSLGNANETLNSGTLTSEYLLVSTTIEKT